MFGSIVIYRDRAHRETLQRVTAAWWTANLASSAVAGKLPPLQSILDRFETRPQTIEELKATMLTAAANIPGVRIRKGKKRKGPA